MFTRKHFQAIAGVMYTHMQTASTPDERRRVRDVIYSFATLFKADNSEFKTGKFYLACGLTNIGADPKEVAEFQRNVVAMERIPSDKRKHRKTGPHEGCTCLHCNPFGTARGEYLRRERAAKWGYNS